MGLGDALLAIGRGASQGYLGGQMELYKREQERRQRQNRLLMGLAPYIRGGQYQPNELEELFPGNLTAQGMAKRLVPKEKPFDIDEVTRLGKSIEIYDDKSMSWRNPNLDEVYPLVKNPEDAIKTGRFRFKKPVSLRSPAGKNRKAWEKAIGVASSIIMGDINLLGSSYEEKMQMIVDQAEALYPRFEKLEKGVTPKTVEEEPYGKYAPPKRK